MKNEYEQLELELNELDTNKSREIENKLNDYYADMRKLETLEYQKKTLIKANETLEERLQGVKIQFEEKVGSIDYSKERVNGGKIENQYERQIEEFYGSIEKNIKINKMKLVDIEKNIVKLINNNQELILAIAMLKDEAKKVLELKYKNMASQEAIGMELHLSRATVQRTIENIKKELLGYMEYMV